MEHQREPHREREHVHGQEPADCLLLRVGDERVGHTECHSNGTLGRRGPGESSAGSTLGVCRPVYLRLMVGRPEQVVVLGANSGADSDKPQRLCSQMRGTSGTQPLS